MSAVKKISKKILFILIISTLAMTIQHKYDIAFKIVYLENRYFHKDKEEFLTDLKINSINASYKDIYRLDIENTAKFSISPSYQVILFIPADYTVLNPPEKSVLIENNLFDYIPYTYDITSKKYRDIHGKLSLLIYSDENFVEEKPFYILYMKDGNIVYKEERFSIKSDYNGIILNEEDKEGLSL